MTENIFSVTLGNVAFSALVPGPDKATPPELIMTIGPEMETPPG